MAGPSFQAAGGGSGGDAPDGETFSVSSYGSMADDDFVLLHVVVQGVSGPNGHSINFTERTDFDTGGVLFHHWPQWLSYGATSTIYRVQETDAATHPATYNFSVTAHDPGASGPFIWSAQWVVYRGVTPAYSALAYNQGRFSGSLIGDSRTSPGITATQSGDTVVVGIGLWLGANSPTEPTGTTSRGELSPPRVEIADLTSDGITGTTDMVWTDLPSWAYTTSPWTVLISDVEIFDLPPPTVEPSTEIAKCQLHIPHKNWATDPSEAGQWRKYRENLLTIERWTGLVMDSESGCRPCSETGGVPTQ